MIECLSEIFSGNGLIEIVDGLRVNGKGVFNIEKNSSLDMICLYVDLTARLGVEIAGMQLPLVGKQRCDAITIELKEDMEQEIACIALVGGGVSISASNLENLQKCVQYVVSCYPYDLGGDSLKEKKKRMGSEAIQALQLDCKTLQIKRIDYLVGGVLTSIACSKVVPTVRESQRSYHAAQRHFKENADSRILIDGSVSIPMETLLIISLRVAMENFQTIYPYVIHQPEKGKNNIRFDLRGTRGKIVKVPDGLQFEGEESELYRLAVNFAKQEQDPFENVLIKDISEIFGCKNEIGQAIVVLDTFEEKGILPERLITQNYSRGMVDRKALEAFLLTKLGKSCTVQNFNDGREVLHQAYERSWEGDDFLQAFQTLVLPRVSENDSVKIYGVLSEDLDVRTLLKQKVQAMLIEKGVLNVEVEIYRSFKSGYSWIEEHVLPELCDLPRENIKSIKISFPYLLNERGDATFEDESTPTYGIHLDNPDKFFDIPTRWLQELFPVDELISEKLGIPCDAVEFLQNDFLSCTYRFEAFDGSGKQIYQDEFDVKYVQKDYIKKYPQIGKVHVTTGWIRAACNEEVILDQRIVTDTEKAWDILENNILPALETYLLDQYGVSGLVEAQPLFNRLQLNVTMSEIDYDLGYREERISTAEAMQEDIYFYILDWFKTYGERECGHELDNVGLIMPEPIIRKEVGTDFEMILYEDLAEAAQWEGSGKGVSIKEKPVDVKVTEVFWQEKGMHLTVDVTESGILRKAKFLRDMLLADILDLYPQSATVIEIRNNMESVFLEIKPRKFTNSQLTCEEKDRIINNDVVDYSTYLELLNYYSQFDLLHIQPVETTYKGRKIFSIECIKRKDGIFYASNKLKNERISAAFTARHHGNESSSLNSTFMLADKLLEDKNYVLDKINVILVPFINIDGGMLHCEVQRRHPKWLCHPARYNSAGFEFRKDFDHPNTKYGEARLLGKLWDQWLFDVITDNHGFEGHELCQPFSGYISPWYKSFWIPRALYYGYIWFKGSYSHMVKIGNAVRDKVSEAINRDKEIYELNRIFADRFFKYAQKWFPDMFTLDQFNEVVFYWIDTDQKPRAANYGMRNPEITALDWTTEVADETAVGAYMGTNVRAHHISDLATLDVMYECELVVDTGTSLANGELVYTRFRRRPLCSEQ